MLRETVLGEHITEIPQENQLYSSSAVRNKRSLFNSQVVKARSSFFVSEASDSEDYNLNNQLFSSGKNVSPKNKVYSREESEKENIPEKRAEVKRNDLVTSQENVIDKAEHKNNLKKSSNRPDGKIDSSEVGNENYDDLDTNEVIRTLIGSEISKNLNDIFKQIVPAILNNKNSIKNSESQLNGVKVNKGIDRTNCDEDDPGSGKKKIYSKIVSNQELAKEVEGTDAEYILKNISFPHLTTSNPIYYYETAKPDNVDNQFDNLDLIHKLEKQYKNRIQDTPTNLQGKGLNPSHSKNTMKMPTRKFNEQQSNDEIYIDIKPGNKMEGSHSRLSRQLIDANKKLMKHEKEDKDELNSEINSPNSQLEPPASNQNNYIRLGVLNSKLSRKNPEDFETLKHYNKLKFRKNRRSNLKNKFNSPNAIKKFAKYSLQYNKNRVNGHKQKNYFANAKQKYSGETASKYEKTHLNDGSSNTDLMKTEDVFAHNKNYKSNLEKSANDNEKQLIKKNRHEFCHNGVSNNKIRELDKKYNKGSNVTQEDIETVINKLLLSIEHGVPIKVEINMKDEQCRNAGKNKKMSDYTSDLRRDKYNLDSLNDPETINKIRKIAKLQTNLNKISFLVDRYKSQQNYKKFGSKLMKNKHAKEKFYVNKNYSPNKISNMYKNRLSPIRHNAYIASRQYNGDSSQQTQKDLADMCEGINEINMTDIDELEKNIQALSKLLECQIAVARTIAQKKQNLLRKIFSSKIFTLYKNFSLTDSNDDIGAAGETTVDPCLTDIMASSTDNTTDTETTTVDPCLTDSNIYSDGSSNGNSNTTTQASEGTTPPYPCFFVYKKNLRKTHGSKYVNSLNNINKGNIPLEPRFMPQKIYVVPLQHENILKYLSNVPQIRYDKTLIPGSSHPHVYLFNNNRLLNNQKAYRKTYNKLPIGEDIDYLNSKKINKANLKTLNYKTPHPYYKSENRAKRWLFYKRLNKGYKKSDDMLNNKIVSNLSPGKIIRQNDNRNHLKKRVKNRHQRSNYFLNHGQQNLQ